VKRYLGTETDDQRLVVTGTGRFHMNKDGLLARSVDVVEKKLFKILGRPPPTPGHLRRSR
jgi:hypothetical protein